MDLLLLKQRVMEGDDAETAELTQQALDEQVPPQTILGEALMPAMEEAGDLFASGEYFVPELLLAARAMSSALDVLRPHLVKSGYEPLGKVIMGTVEGDLHDIGKNLVSMMLQGCGFEVVDLGCGVPPARFAEAARDNGARLVGLSALLTTTLPSMEAAVRAIRATELADSVRVMVGGAPVTDTFAREIGADGYAADAAAAAVLARELLGLPTRASSAA
jgi:5-methyltetrahydrofolate--homocysteine methyltransferase